MYQACLPLSDNSPLNGYSTFCLAIKNNAAANICVKVFVWTYLFISLGFKPKGKIAGCLCLTVWRTNKPFSSVAPFYNPTNNEWGFNFFHILGNLLSNYLFVCLPIYLLLFQFLWRTLIYRVILDIKSMLESVPYSYSFLEKFLQDWY